MKTIILNLIVCFFILIATFSCNKNKPPQQIACVRIQFDGFTDSDMAKTSIIETEKNDTTVYLDTIINEFLLSKTNGYQFELRFKTEKQNGDYIIITDSISEVSIISEVEVNKDFTFTYLFDGIKKTEKDKFLIIYKNN